MHPFIAIFAVSALVGCSAAGREADSVLQARAGADDRSLELSVGSIAELRVDTAFRYIGGQRFLLRDAAAAEQHFFVATAPGGEVTGVFWVQLEQLLPSSTSSYDYSEDPLQTVDGVPVHVQTRRYESPPPPDGDRGRAYAFLESRGYYLSAPAVRARLVHLPDASKREELMIIYIEPSAGSGDLSAEESDALVQRALDRIELVAR